MTSEELIGEGQRLAKPCVYLVTEQCQGAVVRAVWGGHGIIPSPPGPFKHWLSVEGSVFPASVSTMPAVLSIYSNEDDYVSGAVAIGQFGGIQGEETDGLGLYARTALSLPPIDAIFKFGSQRVRSWLAENHWRPAEDEDEAEYAYNDNFPGKAVVDTYQKVWQDQLPLFTGGAYAVLGGWHIPWPDGDWYNQLDKTLLVWTFEDSEPWLEVWRDTNQLYTVVQRFT